MPPARGTLAGLSVRRPANCPGCWAGGHMQTVAVGRPHACPVGMPPGPGARETAARAEKLPDAGARTVAGFCGPVWAGRRMDVPVSSQAALAAAMGGLLTLPFRTALTCTCARLVRDGVLPQPPLRTAMGVQARRLFGYRAPGPAVAVGTAVTGNPAALWPHGFLAGPGAHAPPSLPGGRRGLAPLAGSAPVGVSTKSAGSKGRLIGLPLAGSAPMGAPCGRAGGASRAGQKSALRRR